MTKLEIHYLRCLDQNCEKFPCVARRDYENKILVLKAKVKKLEKFVKRFNDRSDLNPYYDDAREALFGVMK